MDESSATRPDASTVHRMPVEQSDPLTPSHVFSDLQPDSDLEQSPTVIRGTVDLALKEVIAELPDNVAGQTPAALTKTLVGQSLNHFELIEQIGGGGMGAVFRARDTRLGRTVAVKVIPFAHGDPELQRRFRNEAQSAAKLDHPMIARVFEVGNDGPWHYIVFEYIDGQNIRDIVEKRGPLSIDDAVFYTCQLAEAIGHAARRGIVHRDVKPSNVIVTGEGPIKLVDMGLARSDSFDASEDLTASGVTLGTFDYISPEQARDPRVADVRSDLYSLGCTLYFMLTGSPPFPGGTMLQKLLSHGNAAIPDVRASRSDASVDLAAILRKMLAKQPEQRYQRTSDLVADLVELARRESLKRSRGVAVAAIDENADAWRRLRLHLPWMVAASVLVISAGWLELMSWQTRRDFNQNVLATVSNASLESIPPRPVNGPASSAIPPRIDGQESNWVPRIVDPAPPSMESPASGVPTTLGPSTLASPTQEPLASGSSTLAPSSLGPSSLGTEPLVGPQPLIGVRTPPINDSTPVVEPSMATDASSPLAVAPNLGPASMSMGEPVTASSTSPTMTSRPSDPPSLQGFPLPATGNETMPGTDPVTMAAIGKTAPAMSASEAEWLTIASQANLGDSMLDWLADAGQVPQYATLMAPDLVRVVSRPSMNSIEVQSKAQTDRAVLVDSLADALQRCDTLSLDRIEIATPLLVSDPVKLTRSDLLITSTAPLGTAIVFRSPAEVDMASSEMMDIGNHRLELERLHFYWTVPATETDGGSMFSLDDNRGLRLTDCSITIDNPSLRDAIHAFHVTAAADTGTTKSSTTVDATPTLPLVSIELSNVIIRGQISMLKMETAAELQLLWENGLLAVSRRMLETGGSTWRPRPTSGAMQLALSNLTAIVPEGLILMRLDSSRPFPVVIERRAEDSVFVVNRGIPMMEIDGLGRSDRDGSWLKWRGSGNAYETDNSLSDVLLMTRDEFGQSQTVTMNDLFADGAPTWADDRTPRWVIRWSQPIPKTLQTSRFVPADFRQDGSLVGGFVERALPRMPMERSFDFAPPQ